MKTEAGLDFVGPGALQAGDPLDFFKTATIERQWLVGWRSTSKTVSISSLSLFVSLFTAIAASLYTQ